MTNYDCSTCCDEGVVANDDDGTPWSHWANIPPPSNLAVVAGIVRPIPCPAQCARGIVATACIVQTGLPFLPEKKEAPTLLEEMSGMVFGDDDDEEG